jgi:ribosomal protein L29
MKKEELKDLRELSVKELEDRKRELARKVYETRVQVRLGRQKNHSLIRGSRLDIARINTIIRQKQADQARENA